VNPDFGQVEADPAVVNLTTFETYFEEKRPFFIEGKNIMDFGLTMGDGGLSQDNLFYSRRIGRQPRYNPNLDDDEYMDMPQNTTIMGAAKLTGKTRNGWSIGVLESVTDKEQALIDRPSGQDKMTVEPLTNYSLARLQKDFNEGSTQLGGMFTSTIRSIRSDHLQDVPSDAHTGGLDFIHRWAEKKYHAGVKTVFSHVTGTPGAIARAQTSAIRYFQRPDADYLSVDSNRTSLTGTGGTMHVGKSGGGRWRFLAWLSWRSPELELNDMGYLRSADKIQQVFWVGYRIHEPFSIFRYMHLNFNQWKNWSFGGENMNIGGNVNAYWEFTNYWNMGGGIGREGENLNTTELRGGPGIIYPAGWNTWYNASTDNRKKLMVYFHGSTSWNDVQSFRFNLFSLGTRIRASKAFEMSINPRLKIKEAHTSHVENIDDFTEKRYVRGRINQTETSLSLRFTYNITPDFTVQYYGQPFLSAGKYDDFKYITNPKAGEYEDRFARYGQEELQYDPNEEAYIVDENLDGTEDYRFDNPDFNVFSFRSNLVARWEYQPGSVFYLVWTQGRWDRTREGKYQFSQDTRQLFEIYPHDVILLKFSYRLGL
jgi:hypothetical protein